MIYRFRSLDKELKKHICGFMGATSFREHCLGFGRIASRLAGSVLLTANRASGNGRLASTSLQEIKLEGASRTATIMLGMAAFCCWLPKMGLPTPSYQGSKSPALLRRMGRAVDGRSKALESHVYAGHSSFLPAFGNRCY
jgi:hypothetical protein